MNYKGILMYVYTFKLSLKKNISHLMKPIVMFEVIFVHQIGI